MPVQGNPFHRPGGLNYDGSPVEPNNKGYFILPGNVNANRITTFDNFCKEIPKVMSNYCSITLYPDEIKWVALESSKGKDGAPDEYCASTANARALNRGVHIAI